MTRRARRSVLTGNPPTVLASDGKTKLRRYRVDAVIYAPNVKIARARLREDLYLDDAIIVPPVTGRA